MNTRIVIERPTPEQVARLRPLAQALHNDAFLLDQHLRDGAATDLLREDLAALRDGALAALRVLRDKGGR